jgi:hypothetical protein
MGSIAGMFVASMCILVNLDGTTENARRSLQARQAASWLSVQTADSDRQRRELEGLMAQEAGRARTLAQKGFRSRRGPAQHAFDFG